MGSYPAFNFVQSADNIAIQMNLKCTVHVCDASNSESVCALGCQKILPGNDPESTEVSDDEAPDDDEEFEFIEDINFEVEFFLDDGSTDNKTDEEVAEEIKQELTAQYEKINPFEDGETIIDVK